jgi:hypothetical protein
VALAASLALAPVAEAAGISVFQAPATTYQNTTNNPCVFQSPSNCSDPAGWPSPSAPGNTNNQMSASPLTQTYSGSGYTQWLSVVGTAFILGFDIHQNNGSQANQTLNNFTIRFYNPSDIEIANYVFSGTMSVPDNSGGSSYADYVLAAGCAGTTAGSSPNTTCTQYSPFLVPNGTSKIVMTFGMTGNNDGADQIFAIKSVAPGGQCTDNCPAVPEPATATLLVVGSGLAAVAWRLRRRRQA